MFYSILYLYYSGSSYYAFQNSEFICFYLSPQVKDGNVVTNQEEIDRWKVKDTKASHFIYATVDPAQQESLINCTSAFQMFERLKAKHLHSASVSRFVLIITVS